MDVRRRRSTTREHAATTLEYVGVVVAAAVLTAGIASGAGGRGAAIGERVGARVEELVADGSTSARWRDARERRTSGGELPVRVSRDELRLSPLLPPLSLWSHSTTRRATIAGAALRADATACVLCASLETGHEFGPRASTGSDGTAAGLAAGVDGAARLALASIDASASAERRWRRVRARLEGRARATVGAEADLSLTARAGRDGVVADLEAGAMAGAVARVQARAGIELLGVAITQSGRVEGWAGAGARGAVGVRHEGGATSWKLGWGAALGLGGAGEWEGTVDTSRASPTQRRLARDALVTSLRVAGLSIPYVPDIPPGAPR